MTSIHKRLCLTIFRRGRWLAIIALWLFMQLSASAQKILTLDSCYAMARANYPAIHQLDLLQKSASFNVANAWTARRPQILIAAQASYQSDVTSINVPIPNIDIPSPARDQYNLHAEISQSVTDLYTTKHKVAAVQANAAVDLQKTEESLYPLHDRINQLYFGILILRAQQEQVVLLKKAIQLGLDKTNAAIADGTAIKSNAAQLQAEILKADQHMIELQYSEQAYLDMLAQLINIAIDTATTLITPEAPMLMDDIHRPELKTFELQSTALTLQRTLLHDDVRPRLNLFLQTGIGRPALNLLKPDFDFYYIGGVRFSWNLSSRYTYHNQLQLLSLRQSQLDVQRDVFLFNTHLQLLQQLQDIQRQQALMKSDEAIIQLRTSVSQTTAKQLENGTATANDYITNINAEDQARQNMTLHRMQWLLAQYTYSTTSGQISHD